jgi:hypothetical protein
MMKPALRRLAPPAAALALVGCAAGIEEPQRRVWSAKDLAAVRLDPAAAAADLNAYRAAKGLPPIRLDPALSAMAERQAKAMASAGAISHDAAGSFQSRLAASGIDATEAGENLGGGYLSLSEAMSGWRHSPGHDANLLMAGGSRFGIAIAKNPNTQYGVFWAMEIAGEPRMTTTGQSGFLWGAPSGAH